MGVEQKDANVDDREKKEVFQTKRIDIQQGEGHAQRLVVKGLSKTGLDENIDYKD